MAVRASFTADFASFQKAVQQADVQLKAFEADANKVQTSLNRMGDSFSGQKIISQATLMAAAMEKAGGVTKLTEAELRKLNDTTSEAALKMQKLGYEVPKSFNDIAQAVKDLPQPTQSWADKLTSVTAIFQGLLALQVVRWAQQSLAAVINYTDQLSNLSAATGVSVQGLQHLEDIGITSGVSMESLARSVELLQKNLDDPKAIKAIGTLKLNFDQIRALAPEDQFLAIAEAIAKIEDPVTKARIGTDLFSKSWFQIAPAIHGNIEGVIKDMHHMSDEQVKIGDTLGDYWAKFWLNFSRLGGSAVTEVIGFTDRILTHAQQVEQQRRNQAAGGLLDLGTPAIGGPNLPIGAGATGGSTASIIAELGNRTLESQQKAAAAALETIDAMRKLDEATRGIAADSYLGGIAMLKLGETTRKAGLDFEVFTQKVLQGPGLAIIQGRQAAGAQGGLGPADIRSAAFGDIAAATGKQAATFAENLIGGIPGAIQAAIQGGGSKLQAAGSAFGLALFGPESAATKTITKGVNSLFGAGGTIASIITGSIPIIGSLIGPLVGLFGKLFGPSEESKYVSPLRDEFFRLQGGLETLNPKIQELTGSLKLVQAVFDAKTVNQYNAAIKAVEETLARIPTDVETTVRVNFDVTDFQAAADAAAAGYNFDASNYGSRGGLVTASGIQGFASGGRVLPFHGRGSDTVPAMLTPGEMVLTRPQQRALLAGQGGGTMVIDLRDSVIASDAAMNDLVRRIERGLSRNTTLTRKVRAS